MDKETLANRIANLEFKRLRDELNGINALKLVDKIQVVGVKKEVMVSSFADAVDKINKEHGEDKVPETAVVLYNDLYVEGDSPLDKTPEKKKRSGKASPFGSEKDEYGVRSGTLAHTFVQMCKATPMTMKDAKAAEWNTKKYNFNETLNRLIAEKKASVDDNGMITIV